MVIWSANELSLVVTTEFVVDDVWVMSGISNESTEPYPAPMPFVSPSDRAWPSPRHGGALLVLAWVLSFALLGAALAGAVHWRAPIIAAWPPAGRVFAAIGIMT